MLITIFRDPPEKKKLGPSYAGKLYCCVPGCRSYETNVLADGRRVILHRIPIFSRWPKCRQEIVKRLRMAGYDSFINEETRICEKHFKGEYVHGTSIPTILPSKPRNVIFHQPESQPISDTASKSVTVKSLPDKSQSILSESETINSKPQTGTHVQALAKSVKKPKARPKSKTGPLYLYKKRYCGIPGCDNFEGKILDDLRMIVKMYIIPTKAMYPAYRKALEKRLQSNGLNMAINKETRICAEHFEGEYIHGKSLPTLFPPNMPKRQSTIFHEPQCQILNSGSTSEFEPLTAVPDKVVDQTITSTSNTLQSVTINSLPQLETSIITHSSMAQRQAVPKKQRATNKGQTKSWIKPDDHQPFHYQVKLLAKEDTLNLYHNMNQPSQAVNIQTVHKKIMMKRPAGPENESSNSSR